MSITRWARLVHGQPNTNEKKEWRNEWLDTEKAMSSNGISKPKGYAYSYFNKTHHNVTGNTVKDRPEKITAIDFGLKDKIPSTAYITKITFKVAMRIKGNVSVRVPKARFNMYGGTKQVETYAEDGTGWVDSLYYHSPNRKITNTWQEIEYVMSEKEFHKKGYPIKSLFETRFGIDLLWYQPTKQKTEHRIDLKSIGVVVDYVMPNHKILFDAQTNGDNPRYANIGEEYSVEITHTNNSKATDNIRQIKVNIPDSIQVKSVVGDYDTEHKLWTVKGHGTDKLKLNLINWDKGLQRISLSENVIGNYDYYVYGVPTLLDEGDVRCYVHNIHKGHMEYMDFQAKVNSHDGQIQFNVNVDTRDPHIKVNWELMESSDGVSIEEAITNNLIIFNVPPDEPVDISFRAHFINQQTGEATVSIHNYTATYEVLPAYQYVFSNKEILNDNVCNVVVNPSVNNTQVYRGVIETNLITPRIECGFVNNNLEIGECKLTAESFDKKNYIGKVELKKVTHCNPKSKLTNKLIEESGKNHELLGKEGVLKEEISLTTYVKPSDSVTLQGYVGLDEPTPINANHECFEGDPLNHRGWVELTGIDIEKTNPLYYKVDLDVTYITHDLNTKFEIVKGKSEKIALPELFTSVFELGDNLTEATDIFEVDTDGGFVYDDVDEIDNNNIFTLANNQKLTINTKKILTNVFELIFDWMTVKNNEDSQNIMSRIFKLVDTVTGNSVIEYEYTDVQFNKSEDKQTIESITCTTILRVMNNDLGQDPQTHEMELDYEVLDDEDIETSDKILFGSSLRLKVNQNKFTLIDEGFNGREIEVDDVDLVNGNYVFVSEWVNLNDEGGTEDIVSYINLELNETLLNSVYSEYYDKLILSPFPIPKKQLVFTRESMDGVLYYYHDDGYPFKYRIEPFYQFLNGTNLVTRDGISLFNLNNSYSHFYITNGLVRMGFNKYNGELYLAKYDVLSKSWVTTHYFKMRDDIKFQLALLSSDKITIKAGDDTYFSIWRGHPYIAVSHPSDTIHFDNHFTYIYGDKIDTVEYDTPVMYNLLNTDNLLPLGVGGRYLKSKNISIDDDYRIDDVNIQLNLTEYTALQDSVLQVNCASTNGKVHYFVNGEEIGVSETPPFNYTYKFPKSDVYNIQAVFTGENEVGFSEIKTIKVNQRQDIPVIDPDASTGEYKLQFASAPTVLKYRNNEWISFKLTRGGKPVKNAPVEIQTPASTKTINTNEKGIATITNTNAAYSLGVFEWGARFYAKESEVPDKLVCSVFKKIKLVKGDVYFRLMNAPAGNIYKVRDNVTINLSDYTDVIGQFKVIYRLNNGAKKTKRTNDKGNISFKLNTKGTYTIKVYFSGNAKYNSKRDTFTVKVS